MRTVGCEGDVVEGEAVEGEVGRETDGAVDDPAAVTKTGVPAC